MPFYAVAFGTTRGVLTKWDDCKKSIANFPRPVYKKFETQEEAEKFVKEHESEPVNKWNLRQSSKYGPFYTVARGKIVGIFDDFEYVKQCVAGYPKPMYKKHPTFSEALAYFNKYNKVDEGIENISVGTKESGSDGDAEDVKSVSSIGDESPKKNKKRRHTNDEENVAKDEKAGEEEGLENDMPKKVKSN